MASGRTHAKVAYFVLASGIAVSGYAYLSDPSTIAVSGPICAGLVNGLAVSPDIDIQHSTVEEKRWKSIPIIGFPLFLAFSTFWQPYALIVPHRGISHVLIIGTFTRFVYQFAGFIFWSITFDLWMAWVAGKAANVTMLVSSVPLDVMLLYFAGWCVQDAGHLLFDMKLWGRMRRRSRRPLGLMQAAFLVLVATFVAIWLFG